MRRSCARTPTAGLLHAALRPVDPAAHDVVVVGLLHEALATSSCCTFVWKPAMCTPRATTVPSGLFSMVMTFVALLERGDGGAAAGEARADHEHVALLGVDVAFGDGVGRDLQLCFPATSGPAEAPLSATGMPPSRARGARSRGLARVGLRLGRAAGHPGNGRTGERGAAQTQERSTRKALLLFSSMSDSLLGLLAPGGPFCARCAAHKPKTYAARHHPADRGKCLPTSDFPLPGGCFSHGRCGTR